MRLAEGLRVDDTAVSRNLALTGGLIVSERLVIELTPMIGRERVDALLDDAMQGGDLRALLAAELGRLPHAERPDIDELLDPARYIGRAAKLVDDAVADRA